MGKSSGGVRTLTNGSQEYNRRQREVSTMLASGKYSSVVFSEKGGGYVAIEKSTAKHKSEEIEAANILASKGYKVILKDEAGLGHQVKTPDGYLFTASFEQGTPTKDSPTNIRNKLFHAQNKRKNEHIDIAVLYSRRHLFSRKSVDAGIKLFEEGSSYRFKQILVVADNGHVHRYKHNK